MHRLLTAALFFIAITLSAHAQQHVSAGSQASLWIGGYAGIHVGTGTVEFDSVFDSSSIDRPNDNEDAVLGQFFDLNSGLAGVQIGYNFNAGRLIYGVELDWTSFSPSDRLYDPEDEGPGGSTTDNATVDLNWLASIRGRVGIMSARSLLFATAGIAWVDGDYTARDDDGAAPGLIAAGTADIGAAGIVVGAGLEHALTNRFLIRLEGLYYDFNNRVSTASLNNDSDPGDFAKIENILVARLAASYRFGGPTPTDPIPFAHLDWSGLTIGGHIGYAHTEFDSLFDSSEISNAFDNEDSVLGRFFDLDGTVGGLQIGYNRSHGRLVFGVEADWTNLHKNDLLVDPAGGNADDDFASVDLHWMASLRGRIGVTSANTLFFATAGVAWIKGDYTAVDDMVSAGKVSIDDVGFVVGGGLEHALNRNILVRLEGLHYSFGDRTDTSSLTPDSDVGDFAQIEDVTVFRLGVNYKLNFKH